MQWLQSGAHQCVPRSAGKYEVDHACPSYCRLMSVIYATYICTQAVICVHTHCTYTHGPRCQSCILLKPVHWWQCYCVAEWWQCCCRYFGISGGARYCRARPCAVGAAAAADSGAGPCGCVRVPLPPLKPLAVQTPLHSSSSGYGTRCMPRSGVTLLMVLW